MKTAKSSSARTVWFFFLIGVLVAVLAGCSPSPPQAAVAPSPKSTTKSGLTPDDVSFLNWIMAAEKQRRDSDDKHSKFDVYHAGQNVEMTEQSWVDEAETQARKKEYAAEAQRIRSQPTPPDCRPLAKAYVDYLQTATKRGTAASIIAVDPKAEKAALELKHEVAAFQAKHPDNPVDLSPLRGSVYEDVK